MKNTHSLNASFVALAKALSPLESPVIARDYVRIACQRIDSTTIFSLELSKASKAPRAVHSHRVGPVVWVQDYYYATQADLDAALALDVALDADLDALFSR